MNFLDEKSEQNAEINFESEIAEFITGNLIKKYEALEKGQGYAKLLIFTLEDIKITIICSTTKGIEVIESDVENDKKKFDSFEQLFSIYSVEYKKEFNKKLFEKLLQVQENDSKENI